MTAGLGSGSVAFCSIHEIVDEGVLGMPSEARDSLFAK